MKSAALTLFAIFAAAHSTFAQHPGESVYKQRCAQCHESGDSRAPQKTQLQKMSASRIRRTLDFGLMMSITYMLTREEREAVSTYLGTPEESTAVPPGAACADRKVTVAQKPKVAWNGWSPEPTNSRFMKEPGLSLDQLKNLKLKWAFGFEGDANSFAPPGVLDDQLFVGSASGAVRALDAKTGCIRWTYQAYGPVRTAMLVAPLSAGRHALLFGDQTGWFYSVDAATGKLLWQKKPEEHESTKLTGAPLAYNGIVYVPVASWEEGRPQNPKYECCTFRGSVVAYRIATGARLWKTWMIPEPPRVLGKNKDGVVVRGPSGAGIWSAPTLDHKRGLLYVTTGNNYSSTGIRGADGAPCVGDDDDAPANLGPMAACGKATPMSDAVVAISLTTGRIAWARQVTPHDVFNGGCTGGNCPGPDFDFGASVILEKTPDGRDILLAGQKSGIVYGMDPGQKGAILWQRKVGRGGTNGGVQWGMASDGQRVYASVSDVVRVRRPGDDPLDFRPAGVDPAQGGGLTAMRIADGEKAWFAAPVPCPANQEICSPAQPSALTTIPGAVFSGSVDGHMRAFAAEDGRILWDFDTAREFSTVNGVRANGGSIDGAGAVVAGGMVYVSSGYARNGGMAGNVLLAFGPE